MYVCTIILYLYLRPGAVRVLMLLCTILPMYVGRLHYSTTQHSTGCTLPVRPAVHLQRSYYYSTAPYIRYAHAHAVLRSCRFLGYTIYVIICMELAGGCEADCLCVRGRAQPRRCGMVVYCTVGAVICRWWVMRVVLERQIERYNIQHV